MKKQNALISSGNNILFRLGAVYYKARDQNMLSMLARHGLPLPVSQNNFMLPGESPRVQLHSANNV